MQTLGDYRTALLNLAPASAKQASPILESYIRAYRHCGRGGGPIHCARQAITSAGTNSRRHVFGRPAVRRTSFPLASFRRGSATQWTTRRVCCPPLLSSSCPWIQNTRTPGQSHRGHDASLAVSRETGLKKWQPPTVAVLRSTLAWLHPNWLRRLASSAMSACKCVDTTSHSPSPAICRTQCPGQSALRGLPDRADSLPVRPSALAAGMTLRPRAAAAAHQCMRSAARLGAYGSPLAAVGTTSVARTDAMFHVKHPSRPWP